MYFLDFHSFTLLYIFQMIPILIGNWFFNDRYAVIPELFVSPLVEPVKHCSWSSSRDSKWETGLTVPFRGG